MIKSKAILYAPSTMNLLFVITLASAVCCAASLNLDLVRDFINFKQSKNVVFFLCNSLESAKIYTSLSNLTVFVKIVDMENGTLIHPPDILRPSIYARTSCVFDYGCKSAHSVLQKFSEYQYFNITFNWLLIANDNSPVKLENLLWDLNGIQMNSDVTAIAPIADSIGMAYDLLDVYAPGKHLCKDIYQLKFAQWNKNDGTVVAPEFSRFHSRSNFNGLRLRGVTVIDRDNITSNDVDRILSAPGREHSVALLIKYHYALLSILREYHNFTIKYRVARGWAGRFKSGYRLGLLGILSRNEADVATTGVFQRLNRHAEFDFIHHSWKFSAGFLYRMTPLLRDSSGTGSFLTPFDNMVWIALAITIIAILMVLKLVSLIIMRLKRYESNRSFMTYVVDIIATVAQQGVSSNVSHRVSIRIIIFSLLFLTLLLYNYYTSSVVGSLLSSPGKGPQTIKEITASPLQLSFLDIGYHKVLFTETKDPAIREMYRKKVQPSREGKHTIPVFTDVPTAVPYLKQGGYAFHCELTEAFQDIANQFDAYEICELRTGASLFSDLQLLGMILPKRSMYTELFKTTLMRAQEVGLIKRTLKIHRPEKPICQVGSRIHPVELNSVKMAFSVLGAGFGISLILLSIERLWYNSVLKRESMNFID